MSRSRQFKWVKKGIGQLEFKIESQEKELMRGTSKKQGPVGAYWL